MIICPTATHWMDDRGLTHKHDIIGCGLAFEAAPDSDGFYDCPKCAMCFAPDNPTNTDVTP